MYAFNKGFVQISNPIKKIGQDMTVKRKKGKCNIWKMFNLTPVKRNANCNYMRYHFHLSDWQMSTNFLTHGADQGVRKPVVLLGVKIGKTSTG